MEVDYCSLSEIPSEEDGFWLGRRSSGRIDYDAQHLGSVAERGRHCTSPGECNGLSTHRSVLPSRDHFPSRQS